jgi:beta-1,4-N-acetylglucosaminyltransferase
MANTDTNSEFKARSFEESLGIFNDSSPTRIKHHSSISKNGKGTTKDGTVSPDSRNPFQICRIPRSRHVHQSWVSTPFTTLYSLALCFQLVWRENPDVIVCNGPGTCIPLCISARILTFFRLMRCKLIFVESFARVADLSLSGKIMYHLADRFIIHWPTLLEKYPKAEYLGKLL